MNNLLFGGLVSVFIPVISIVAAFFIGGDKQYFDAQKLSLETDTKILGINKDQLISQVNLLKNDSIHLFATYRQNTGQQTFRNQYSYRLRDKQDLFRYLFKSRGNLLK